VDISVVDCIVTAARDIEKLGVSTFSTTQPTSNIKIVIRGSSMLFLVRLFILGYPRIIFLQCQRLAATSLDTTISGLELRIPPAVKTSVMKSNAEY